MIICDLGDARALGRVAMRVALVTYPSAYTDRAPAIELRSAPDAHCRANSVALHSVAAAVELAFENEGWHVQAEQIGDHRGRVILLLSTEGHAETRRGLAVLREVVERSRAS